MAASTIATQSSIVVIGRESVGKSQLITSLTGRHARSDNFRGSTVACETYACGNLEFVDTPGIIYGSDTLTTRSALEQLESNETVLLLAQSTDIDMDLREGLPLACGHPCVIAVTFWDKVSHLPQAESLIAALQRDLGVTVIAVDARSLTALHKDELRNALGDPQVLRVASTTVTSGWALGPARSFFDRRWLGIAAASFLLFAPAVTATWLANTCAGLVDPLVEQLTGSLAGHLPRISSLPYEILVGNYGLVTMGPLLLVWAVPTVLLYSLFLGMYKASGILDKISIALHPLTQKVGLSGRDLIRVLMGYGCNVPAVISTRGCSSCTRSTTITTIAFGSICSYQFSATVGVFAAARHPFLILPFLLYILGTTIVVARLASTTIARSPFNILSVSGQTYMQWPTIPAVWREARSSIYSFFRKAIPVFFCIAILASFLTWCGALQFLSHSLGPVMRAFRLPVDAALPVILASVRKDGILVLARTSSSLALRPGQLLTAVYLAGQFVPCLVTVLTIARECSTRFAVRVMARQIVATVIFSMILAQAAWLLHF